MADTGTGDGGSVSIEHVLHHHDGLVTLMFTDVEGSTALWEADQASMAASLEQHDDVVRALIEDAGGYVFTTAGDSFAAAFADCRVALTTARNIQEGLGSVLWAGPALQVRIGLHVGNPLRRGGDFFGPAVAVAARVEAAGHGGQILVTDDVLSAAPSDDATRLGSFRLRGVDDPVIIHQIGGADRDFPPLRITPPGRIDLPSVAGDLVGRTSLLHNVTGALKAERLVTLSGPGGAGKTRLAIEAAEIVTGSFHDGVTFVDLARIDEGLLVSGAVLEALGESASSAEGAAARITAILVDQRRLVILDNCEHVIDAVTDLVEQALDTSGEGVFLATSRERLGLPHERVHLVEPLDTRQADGPAVELFRNRVEARNIPLSDGPETVAIVHRLVTALDGIPLAIELAATRTATMGPAELLRSLDHLFDVLRADRRRRHRDLGRHATLRATVEWSYSLLDADEQAVFLACGIMLGAFDLDMVSVVAGRMRPDAEDIVASLIDKSLLVPVDHASGRRFRMLQTLRAYALEQLGELGHEVAARSDLARFLADRHRWIGTGGDLLADADNIRASVRHVLANHADDADLCVQLVAADLYIALDHMAQRTVAPPAVVDRLLANVDSVDAFRLACNVTADGRADGDDLLAPFSDSNVEAIRRMATMVRHGVRYFSSDPLPTPDVTFADAASWTDDPVLSLFCRLVTVRSPAWDREDVLDEIVALAADFRAVDRPAHADHLLSRLGLIEAVVGVSGDVHDAHPGVRAIVAFEHDARPDLAAEQLDAMRTRCIAAPRAHAVVETLLTAAGLARALGRPALAQDAAVCCGSTLGIMPLDGWMARELDVVQTLRRHGGADGPWARLQRFDAIVNEVHDSLVDLAQAPIGARALPQPG